MMTLLEAGASADSVDKTTMETAFDVANTEEARQLLVRNRMILLYIYISLLSFTLLLLFVTALRIYK
jgi:hypothetical protein